MPKRTDIHSILLIGSGPIVIGQACEFDYSGTQACKALREEGYRIILVNSNPATIMTDPEFADRTYIEPLTVESVTAIIARERPDAVLPTLGGQTALNLAMGLHEAGVLEQYGVQLIGASVQAIRTAEDRQLFKNVIEKLGLKVPAGVCVSTPDEARDALAVVGLPAILRPAFTMGGTGGGIARTRDEYEQLVAWGLAQSPVSQILIEASVLGWKEYELEVMRDTADNVVIICSIENLDPMGVHTGDSITVAPAQTLTDKEYQHMRDAARAIIRAVGVDTGGSNIQFAINPANGDMIVIEMNPRVSRSSALASKATGYPIAKIAAKLAVGYTLDELRNDITRTTTAGFEPTIDYVVTKIPRFAFEKFPTTDSVLTTQMKSVGEVMAIGRTFPESLHKAIRALEQDRSALQPPAERAAGERLMPQFEERLSTPRPNRLWWVAEAMRCGIGIEKIHEWSAIDPWFLYQMQLLIEMEQTLVDVGLRAEEVRQAKRLGFSDAWISELTGVAADEIRALRRREGIVPVYRMVDTCAAEFAAHTPYLYSTYDGDVDDEALPTERRKILILGSGPNRIGQGIEFDYCCVQAVFALRSAGVEAIMVNSNPETVSTDYDTADRLFFEPITFEDVMSIIDRERPDGVLLQFGGQTPLKLARQLEAAGVKILGTAPRAIDLAEDRGEFRALLDRLHLRQPLSGLAHTLDDAQAVAAQIGFPVLVRPSYVLGGRAMKIVDSIDELTAYMQQTLTEGVTIDADRPMLIDRYLAGAVEVDVDVLCDGTVAKTVGVMEHIEEAGIHSGDSSCVLPPYTLSTELQQTLYTQAEAMACALPVIGLLNVQFAVHDGVIYVLEANPRASRTVPFVAKAIGVPVVQFATRLCLGEKLNDVLPTVPVPEFYSVKSPVFPFIKFAGVDVLLGPEMKSTGEVMGIDTTPAGAYLRAQQAASQRLPKAGRVFVSVRAADKAGIVPIAQHLIELGFTIGATDGTAATLNAAGIAADVVRKVKQGSPHVVDQLRGGDFVLVINTTAADAQELADSFSIRRTTLEQGIPYFTTLSAARAGVDAMAVQLSAQIFTVRSLQEWHADLFGTPERRVGNV